MDFFTEFFRNPVVLPTFLGWILAQILKVFTNFMKYRKWDLARLFGSGGMPSSHTSFVMALAVSCGISEGFDSAIFVVAAAFAAIVMTDAMGVRQAAGKQARVLNEIVDMMTHNMVVPPSKLKELIGHTGFEVLMGAILGTVVAILFTFR